MLAYGVNWWNRAPAAAMSETPLKFVDDVSPLFEAVRSGEAVAVWASRVPPDLEEATTGTIVRIEDGFIRSPGLGALFAPAFSLIFDSSGVYYDPTRPSDLESVLAGTTFSPADLDRASALRERVIQLSVSKYAVADRRRPKLSSPPAQARVLVVGQVEDDASIRLGGGAVKTNLELLEAAREANPGAWIAYKPHPDVLKAGRKGHASQQEVLRFADAIWPNAPISAALDWAEAVHTISSLAGFEALLRMRRVVVYGRPFYAGWGLTEDRSDAAARRGVRLELNALVAATLIRYPRYMDPFTGARCEPERLLDRIEAGWRDPYRGRPLWHRAAAAAKRTFGPLRRFL